ncbi:MAG TPA: hypothetical protein VFS39_05690 [Nitrospira sp.]|nr:hypothetical protein [Nitrospira sp.]
MKGALHILTLVTTIAAGFGCSGAKVTTHASSELPRYQVRTMVLLPFTAMGTPQVRDVGDQYVSTPQGALGSDIALEIPPNVEPPIRQTVAVPRYAAEKVTQLFWVRLRNWKGINVLPPSEAAKVAMPAGDAAKTTPEAAAAHIAKALRADAALMGQVLVYQERVGSRLGANPPATVGFEVKLVAADGQVLWVGNYYEKQKPMTQDFVAFIQHGGGFVTAEDLARYGVDSILKHFPFGSPGGS